MFCYDLHSQEVFINEEIMEHFLKVLPLLKDILSEDIAVGITDTTKFLYYRPGDTIKMNIREGDAIAIAGALYKLIQKGKRYEKITSFRYMSTIQLINKCSTIVYYVFFL